ncbi:radical SAM protein [archaeon]|jgi:radical SAM protein with 4Fe4S-binding SPASM domain|nr:radical SAM protein [archaeon]
MAKRKLKISDKKFKIVKPLKSSGDKSVYGFSSQLDETAIGKAIESAGEKMPSFVLSKIEIHPSKFCNLKCSCCYGAKLAPEILEGENLSLESIDNTLEDVKENFSQNPLIILSGSYSEPLMHPKLNKIIGSLGKNKFRFGLYTNGLLMKEGLMESLLESAESLSSEKPCFVSFNIFGSLNVGRFVRELSPIIEKLSKKRDRLEDKLEIDAPIIVPKQLCNYDFLYEVIGRLESFGVDNVRLTLPWNQLGKIKTKKYESISKKELKRVLEVFRDLERDFDSVRIRSPQETRKHKKCYAMSMGASIGPNGNVYPCPEVSNPFREQLSYGNITKKKFSEIWQSEEHLRLFERLDPKKEGCLCCPAYDDINYLCSQLK